jgi:hypothetical protein
MENNGVNIQLIISLTCLYLGDTMQVVMQLPAPATVAFRITEQRVDSVSWDPLLSI